MNNDFRIDIAPNGSDLRFTLYRYNAGVPDAGFPFNRTKPVLPGQLIANLRRGTATPLEVAKITAQISDWLYGNDINPQLSAALNIAGTDLLRLIISVNDPQLREELADVPIELSMLNNDMVPLALKKNNAAIFHLLSKVGTPPNFTSSTWPLRILIVRSNPADLGGAVPPAAGLRDEIYRILDETPGLNRNLVHVHVLSSENMSGASGRPTREAFRRQLTKATYDIMVYLGHGDVLPVYEGLMPVGVMQLESQDGSAHISVSADQLAVLFHENPVSVVLLVGCLTAAEIPLAAKPGVDSLVPQWVRGSQGLAQALVNSESGVQLAVGMRYMLERDDATYFLNSFFNSLLASNRRGNVEAAVHSARSYLHFQIPGSYSWSAPMIFRTLREEPLFPFLSSPPANICPNIQQHQDLREIFWKNLSATAWSLRQGGGTQPVHAILKDVETQLVNSVLAGAPCLLMPELKEARSEETVTMPVQLYGTLPNIKEMRGNFTIAGGQARIVSLEPGEELLAKGYDMLTSVKGNQARFYIERDGGSGTLQKGTLFNATIEVGAVNQMVYPISVDIIRTSPEQAICSGINALIVLPP